MWRFYNRRTGRFDPSYQALARFHLGRDTIGTSSATVGRYLDLLEELGVMVRQRRCDGRTVDRGFELFQLSNAYRLVQSAEWRFPIKGPPPPHPTAWGARGPIELQTAAQARREAKAAGAPPAIVAERMLEAVEYSTQDPAFVAAIRRLGAVQKGTSPEVASEVVLSDVAAAEADRAEEIRRACSPESRAAAAAKWVRENSRRGKSM